MILCEGEMRKLLHNEVRPVKFRCSMGGEDKTGV